MWDECFIKPDISSLTSEPSVLHITHQLVDYSRSRKTQYPIQISKIMCNNSILGQLLLQVETCSDGGRG